MSNMLSTTTADAKIYTIVKLDDKSYAIKTQYVLEILKIIELDYPDDSSGCVAGVMQYQKKPLSVIDLRSVLNKERKPYNLDSKIAIVEYDKYRFGLVVDLVSDIKRIENAKVESLPYKQQNSFFEGVFEDDEVNSYVLNIEAVKNYIQNDSTILDKNNRFEYDEETKNILKNRKMELVNQNKSAMIVQYSFPSGIIFLIDNIKYYIDMKRILRFHKLKSSKLIKIPCAQDFILGLTNVRGEYITIFDIKRFYKGSSTKIKDESILIILDSNEFKIGILADEICENININKNEILKSEIHKRDDFSLSEFIKGDDIYQIVDVDNLLKDPRLIIV